MYVCMYVCLLEYHFLKMSIKSRNIPMTPPCCMLKYDISHLNRALELLKFFHSVSGLKVNIEKTKAVQFGVKGDGGIKHENSKL